MLRSKCESLGSCKGGMSKVKRQVRRCQVGTLLLLSPSTHGKGRHVLIQQMCWQTLSIYSEKTDQCFHIIIMTPGRAIARYSPVASWVPRKGNRLFASYLPGTPDRTTNKHNYNSVPRQSLKVIVLIFYTKAIKATYSPRSPLISMPISQMRCLDL